MAFEVVPCVLALLVLSFPGKWREGTPISQIVVDWKTCSSQTLSIALERRWHVVVSERRYIVGGFEMRRYEHIKKSLPFSDETMGRAQGITVGHDCLGRKEKVTGCIGLWKQAENVD